MDVEPERDVVVETRARVYPARRLSSMQNTAVMANVPEAEERLSDRLAVATLTWAFPPPMVEEAIRASGRAGVRTRLLPPLIMVYYVLAMCLFPKQGYVEVARRLGEGLALSDPRGIVRLATIPSTAAISRARMRLGAEPFKALLAQTASRPPGGRSAPDARFAEWRLRVLDGRTVEVPDSPENVAGYGLANRGPEAGPGVPAVRVSVLAEDGSGTLAGAEIVSGALGVREAAGPLLRHLGPGDLVLADREYGCPELFRSAAATGAELLWSLPTSAVRPGGGRRLPDGSYLAELTEPPGGAGAGAATVRVVGDAPGDTRRLVTTILEPAAAPVRELRRVHSNRWTFVRAVELVADFRMSHKKAPVRSRSPEMVEQELWGHLLVYTAVRRLAAGPII